MRLMCICIFASLTTSKLSVSVCRQFSGFCSAVLSHRPHAFFCNFLVEEIHWQEGSEDEIWQNMQLLHCTHFFPIWEGDCNYFDNYIENDDDDRFWAPFAALSNYSTDTLIFDSQFHGRARERRGTAQTLSLLTMQPNTLCSVFVFVLAMQGVWGLLLCTALIYNTYVYLIKYHTAY